MKLGIAVTIIAGALSTAAIAQTTTPSTTGTPPATTPGSAVTTPMATPPAGTAGSATNVDTNRGNAGAAAVTTTSAPSRTDAAPVSGANSFTEAQARDRMQDKGFANVTDLKKDDKGVWRGTAQKDGKSVSVALDYQGNIVGQ